jgi:alpha-L-fucosidase 2
MKFTAVLGLQTGTGALVARLMDGKKLKVATGSFIFEWPFLNPSDSKKHPTSESLQAMNSIKHISYSPRFIAA